MLSVRGPVEAGAADTLNLEDVVGASLKDRSAQRVASCPVCGRDAMAAPPAAGRDFFTCADPACGLAFIHPQPTPPELEALYRSLYYSPQKPNAGNTYQNTTEQISKYHIEALRARGVDVAGRRVLDFGAGVGSFALAMRALGAHVEAIEPDAEARQQMAARGLTCYADVAALRAAAPDARFDLVTAITVLEHLDAPVRQLAELRELLVPNGCLFATTPNFDSFRARVQGYAWDQYQNPTHLFFFTPASLPRVLRRAGFGRVERLPVRVTYPAHNPARRALQHGLQRAGLDGDIWELAYNTP